MSKLLLVGLAVVMLGGCGDLTYSDSPGSDIATPDDGDSGAYDDRLDEEEEREDERIGDTPTSE